MLAQILIELAQVDAWLDDSVSPAYKAQPLAQDWARLSKIGEELGEAIDAFILHTGQNPRKPQADAMDEVLGELADVACTAILAMLHFTKDESKAGAVLVDKVQSIGRRMVQARRQAQLESVRNSELSQESQRAFMRSLGIDR